MTFKKFPPLLAALFIALITEGALAQAPQLVYAVSRKAHGGVSYDIGLPLTGAAADYAAAILADPDFLKLEAEAAAEPWWISYGPEGRSSGYLKPEA